MNVNVSTLTESIAFAFVESIIIRRGRKKNVNCIINAVCLYENYIIINTQQMIHIV